MLVLGIIFLSNPYTYSVIPVFETSDCIIFYKTMKDYNICDFKSDVGECIYRKFSAFWQTNIAVFIFSNWLELCVMAYALKSILHIRDELNISKEVLLINILWGLLSTVYIQIVSFSIKFE